MEMGICSAYSGHKAGTCPSSTVNVGKPSWISSVNWIIGNIPIPVKIPTAKPYRVFTQKPLNGRVIVSGSIVVKLLGIYLPTRIAVRIVRLYGFGVSYDFTVMVVVCKRLNDLSAAVR